MSRLPATFVTLALAACAHTPSEPRQIVSVGAVLSALPDEPVNGVRFTKADCIGKVVMVFFLSTWCFPCLADLPVMEKLQADYGPQGYVTVAVGMDLEGRKVLGPFAQNYALPYPLLIADSDIREGSSVFGRVRELPTRYVFARDGSLALAFSGVADPKELIEAVGDLVTSSSASRRRP